jgi:hypothetical protein
MVRKDSGDFLSTQKLQGIKVLFLYTLEGGGKREISICMQSRWWPVRARKIQAVEQRELQVRSNRHTESHRAIKQRWNKKKKRSKPSHLAGHNADQQLENLHRPLWAVDASRKLASSAYLHQQIHMSIIPSTLRIGKMVTRDVTYDSDYDTSNKWSDVRSNEHITSKGDQGQSLNVMDWWQTELLWGNGICSKKKCKQRIWRF